MNRTAFLKSLHVSPRLGLVYVNNPKVACSTIKLTLQRAELQDPGYEPPTSVHDHAASPLLTWPDLTGIQAEQSLSDSLVFSFVRNPYERLRSAYLNKIVRPQKKGAFRVSAGFAADELPGFDDFILALADQPPEAHNPHWRGQALNLSVDRIGYDFIGRLECFTADWADLAARTALPPETAFAGKRTRRSDKAELAFSAAAADVVRRVYAADFALFGYDPDPAGNPVPPARPVVGKRPPGQGG